MSSLDAPSIDFFVYLPRSVDHPLFLKEPKSDKFTESFIVPKRGALYILNGHSNSKKGEENTTATIDKILASKDLQSAMNYFVHSFKLLLGMNQGNSEEDAGLNKEEEMDLFERWSEKNKRQFHDSFHSLMKLLHQMPHIPAPPIITVQLGEALSVYHQVIVEYLFLDFNSCF